MDIDELRDLVTTNLAKFKGDSHVIEKNGAVLYSGIDTIKKSNFYIMGYNPGGNSDPDGSIRNHIMNQKSRSYSSYTMECWRKQQSNCSFDDKGRIRNPVAHQRKIIDLCSIIWSVSNYKVMPDVTDITENQMAVTEKNHFM